MWVLTAQCIKLGKSAQKHSSSRPLSQQCMLGALGGGLLHGLDEDSGEVNRLAQGVTCTGDIEERSASNACAFIHTYPNRKNTLTKLFIHVRVYIFT